MGSYIRLNEDGILEQIDLHTGESRLILEKHQKDTLGESGLIRILAEDGTPVWVSRTVTFEDLRKIAGNRKFYPYSTQLAEHICAQIAEGADLVELAGKNGLPNYSTLCRWRRENPEFEEMYKQAKKDRAEFFFYRARQEVERAQTEEDVPVAKLRQDFYKYGAKVGDPGGFQEVQKVDARVAVGVTRLETGVRREKDPGFDGSRIAEIEKQFNLSPVGAALGSKHGSEEGATGVDNRPGSEGEQINFSDPDNGRDSLGVSTDAVSAGGSVRDGGGTSGSGPDSVL